MATRLRFVTVSYVDDNFGDNLIRISFHGLLDVALADHGLTPDEYEVVSMPLKRVDEELLGTADAILFAGGGLFGLSYLNFFEHVERITAVADRRGIPVIFSSMGLNNMSADEGDLGAIAQILTRGCVKALAVRENLELFQQTVKGLSFEARQVADPAVWTKYVYGMTDIVPAGTFGINVVRSGLFVANQRKWGLTAEMGYLAGLMDQAEAAGLDARLYTNGSLDDNKTLRFFAREYAVPDDRVVLPQTTREVVEAVASHSAIAAIRMHSAIIAYSFGIPTVALEWNDKLPHFYEAIGHPERVIPFGDWSADTAFAKLRRAGVAPESNPGYEDYLMSTYTYIRDAVGEHVLTSRQDDARGYDFAAVADALVRRSHLVDEDEFDLRVKMGKAERAYLGRFIAIREKDKRIRDLTKEIATLSKRAGALEKRTRDQKAKVTALEQKVRSQKRELDMRLTTRFARFARRVRRSLTGGRRRPPSSSTGTSSQH